MIIPIPTILLVFCAYFIGTLSSPSPRPPGKTYSMKEPREAAENGSSRIWYRTQSAIVSSQLGTESETERKAAELRRRLEEWMNRGANGGKGSKSGETMASNPDYSETDQETDQEYMARRRTKTDRVNGRRSRVNDDDPRRTMAMKESKRESDERQKHIREQEKRKQIVMYDQDSQERIDSESRRRDHGRNECAADNDQRTIRKERPKQVSKQNRGKQIVVDDREGETEAKREMKIIEKRKESSYLDSLIESERIKAEKEAQEVEPYNEPNSMWSSSWHERTTHRSKSHLALSQQPEKYDDKRRKYYDQDQNLEKQTGGPFSRSFSSIPYVKNVGVPNRQQQQIVPWTEQRTVQEQFWDLNVQYGAKLKECEKTRELKRAELPRAQSMQQVRPTGVSKEGKVAKMVKRVASLTKDSVKEAKRREAEKRNIPKANNIKRWPTSKYQAEPSSGSNNVRETTKEPLLLEYHHQSPKTGIGKKHSENMEFGRSPKKKMSDQESEQGPKYPTDDEEEAQMAIVLVKSLEEHEASSHGAYGDQEKKKENREEQSDKTKSDRNSDSDNDKPNLANLDEDSLLALAIVKSLEEGDEQHTETEQHKNDVQQQPIDEQTYIPIEYNYNNEKYGQKGYEYEHDPPYSGKDVHSEPKKSMIDLDEDAELALAMQESLQMNGNQGEQQHDQQNDKESQPNHQIKGAYHEREDETMDDDILKAIQASLNEEPRKGQNTVPAENRCHDKSSSRIRYPTFADRIGKFKLKSDQSHTNEQYGQVSQPDYIVKVSCKGNVEDETMDDDIRKAIQASLNEEPHHESNSDHPIKGTCHENDDIQKAIQASLNEQSYRGPTRIPADNRDQSSSSSRIRYPTFADRIRHGKLKLELDLSLYSQDMLGRMGISRRRN